jgi:undecaprenyl-diphosphatase
MGTVWSDAVFRHLDAFEAGVCVRLNRTSRNDLVARFFGAVSRLGNGVLWYALMAVLPAMFGAAGLEVSARMAATGAIGVILYRLLKTRMVRRRPFEVHAGVRNVVPPLDRYSFPSGHTLHAVAFTVVAVSSYPPLGWVLVPFALLVAASRVVLGLHYPTDVLAGAALGAAVAWLGLGL